MKVDQEKCIECELCIPYCPVGAIGSIEQENELVYQINQEECVECGVCLKADVCAPEALYMPELEWPRSVRAAFSNPLIKHPATKLEGRGTEEMKTNDVTGRFARGIVGLAVEILSAKVLLMNTNIFYKTLLIMFMIAVGYSFAEGIIAPFAKGILKMIQRPFIKIAGPNVGAALFYIIIYGLLFAAYLVVFIYSMNIPWF